MAQKNLKTLFGAHIQHLRRLKGLTQEELAEAIGRSVDTISNIERGFSSTRIETAANLAKALGVSLPELFEFSGVPKDKGLDHRKDVEKLVRLILQCPPRSFPRLKKFIEQAIELTTDSL